MLIDSLTKIYQMKKIYYLFSVLLLIISCQKENLNESEIEETSTSNEIKHSIISIEEVKKNKKVISSLNKFKKLTVNKSSSKSNDKFKVIESSIKFIQKGDYHSYTFLISNNSASNNIQNLLLSLQNDGSYKSLLITYHLSPEEMRDYSLGGKVNFSTKTTIRPIDLNAEFFNPNIFNKSIECFEYVVTVSQATGWNILVLEEVPCESSTGGGGTGGGFGDDPDPYDPPPSGTGGGGSGGGSGTGTGETIEGCTTDADGNCIGDITSPLVIYETVVTVGNKLGIYNNSSDLGQWLYTQATNYEIVSLNNFLAENEDNLEAKAFAIEAATAFMNDGEVDFEETYIYTETTDDSFVFQGSKELIPNPLVLLNGSEISITYGTTNDNINANQPVSIDLINGMKFAIQNANSNLSASDQITNIYIMATTNGHGTTGTSNHLKATAVDISRINGQKMALTGLTEQIKELQKAMDNYDHVRENFGPSFKHKYSMESDSWNYNHPVKGHKDHIHFSVRR